MLVYACYSTITFQLVYFSIFFIIHFNSEPVSQHKCFPYPMYVIIDKNAILLKEHMKRLWAH